MSGSVSVSVTPQTQLDDMKPKYVQHMVSIGHNEVLVLYGKEWQFKGVLLSRRNSTRPFRMVEVIDIPKGVNMDSSPPVVYGGCVYIFGGIQLSDDGKGGWFNADLHIMDIATREWRLLSLPKLSADTVWPPAFDQTLFVAVDDMLLLFGGMDHRGAWCALRAMHFSLTQTQRHGTWTSPAVPTCAPRTIAMPSATMGVQGMCMGMGIWLQSKYVNGRERAQPLGQGLEEPEQVSLA
ncbi:hypothetical protein KIPB_001734 [Kipferlia bialata]|uniref:Kelch-type beta propeller n=1 Tax=Kipferlia bialata TaxID=797122 RepID=A0A391NIX5_9EUKA|nr:hypothetical protein KIPB_001734 [Kipferlia bialata]|eukprot:g1734.t1